MDPDGRWQKLQLHLRSARAAREAGDVALALQEVDAALSIDPNYLAARVLRESIANPQPVASTVQLSPTQTSPAQATALQQERQSPDLAAAKPASLEERARRRRIEHRTAAARAAILLGRLDEARAALEELVELDPSLPVIPEIEAELDTTRARSKRRRPTLLAAVAAAVVGVIVGTLAGRATQGQRPPATAGSARVAPLAATAMPAFRVSPPALTPRLSAELLEPAAAAADAVPEAIVPVRVDPVPPPPAAVPARAAVVTPAPIAESVSAAVSERPAPAPAVERPSGATPAPVERAPEPPPFVVSPRVERTPDVQPAIAADDPALIRDALQRYRHAYNALDARLAHAVYPGVDEAALTHAFEGLRSQSLEFEACSVDALAESSARAVCRGSARYVPKIGSREPRAEARVWTFRLRKSDGDWRIESAWTDR